MKGQRSHDIVRKALQVLINLEHRGACGCEANTGDGAGILIQMPDAFLRKVGAVRAAAGRRVRRGPRVPAARRARPRARSRQLIARIVDEEGQTLLGWRDVPTDNRLVGDSARATQPVFSSCSSAPRVDDRPTPRRALRFERKLYVIRKRVEHAVDALKINALSRRFFYIVSLSANTLIYKGMLTAQQLEPMFPDLSDAGSRSRRSRSCTSASAPTRSRRGRWRTRTATSRTTARSTRCAATSTGCARARGCSRATLFGDDLQKMLPIIREGGSDTATFDNVLELLVMAGRSLPHAILMMIPEPWSNHESMSPERKAFYEYHSSLMEPWDGPASIAFTDGTVIGAVLDRNGLRPSRYYVTKDDLVDHGVRGRRARHPAARTSSSRSGCTRAGSSSSTRPRAASSTTRRSSASWRRSIRTASGSTSTWSTSTTCRRRAPSSPSTRRCSGGSRRSATRRRTCAC